MSKSIRISDELAARAEEASSLEHRSPPQQIEHWAQIGRILEPALSFDAANAVKRAGRSDLDTAIDQVGTPEATNRTQAIVRRTSGAIVSTD